MCSWSRRTPSSPPSRPPIYCVRRRVVLDACVLSPRSLRDLLLTLAALDAYDVVWGDTILDELARNVVTDHLDIDAARYGDHTIRAMRTTFPNATARTGRAPRADASVKDARIAS